MRSCRRTRSAMADFRRPRRGRPRGPRARGARRARRGGTGGRRQAPPGAWPVPSAARRSCWPSPFEAAIPEILARRGSRVVVLASGDPFHYGIGATLARHVAARETRSVFRAFRLLARRRATWMAAAGLPMLETLHGRAFRASAAGCNRGRPDPRLVVGRRNAGAAGARTRRRAAWAGSRIVVLEAMGGPRENIRETTAGDSSPETGVDPLEHHRGSRSSPRLEAPGHSARAGLP